MKFNLWRESCIDKCRGLLGAFAMLSLFFLLRSLPPPEFDAGKSNLQSVKALMSCIFLFECLYHVFIHILSRQELCRHCRGNRTAISSISNVGKIKTHTLLSWAGVPGGSLRHHAVGGGADLASVTCRLSPTSLLGIAAHATRAFSVVRWTLKSPWPLTMIVTCWVHLLGGWEMGELSWCMS